MSLLFTRSHFTCNYYFIILDCSISIDKLYWDTVSSHTTDRRVSSTTSTATNSFPGLICSNAIPSVIICNTSRFVIKSFLLLDQYWNCIHYRVRVVKTGVPRRKLPTCLNSLTNFNHIMLYPVDLSWAGFELTTLVVIGTDCIGSCKSNYQTIMTTMAPYTLYVSGHFYRNQEFYVSVNQLNFVLSENVLFLFRQNTFTAFY